MLGTHAQALMSAGVVFAEECGQPLIQLTHGFIATDVDVVILHCAPESLDHDVVQSPAFAIHTDLDLMGLEHARKGLASELAALVAVEDLRDAFGLQSLFQTLHAERFVHTVTELPADHVAARPVHNRRQVDVAVPKGNVGDVRAPDLVAPVDLQVPQQVGILLMPFAWNTQTRFWVDRLNPHRPHQPLHTLATNLVSELLEFVTDATTPVGRLFHVNAVNRLHQHLIKQADRALGLVVVARTRNRQ